TGPTNVRVGTLNFAPSVPTTIGSTGNSITIQGQITLPFGAAPTNLPPPAADQLAYATLTTNQNTTLLANNFTLNPGQNGLSTFVQNGGTVQVNGTVALGASAGGATMTLNGGQFIAGGAAALNTIPASIQMRSNPVQNNYAPT